MTWSGEPRSLTRHFTARHDRDRLPLGRTRRASASVLASIAGCRASEQGHIPHPSSARNAAAAGIIVIVRFEDDGGRQSILCPFALLASFPFQSLEPFYPLIPVYGRLADHARDPASLASVRARSSPCIRKQRIRRLPRRGPFPVSFFCARLREISSSLCLADAQLNLHLFSAPLRIGQGERGKTCERAS